MSGLCAKGLDLWERRLIVNDYHRRRRRATRWASCPGEEEYSEWINAFEQFMWTGFPYEGIAACRDTAARPDRGPLYGTQGRVLQEVRE